MEPLFLPDHCGEGIVIHIHGLPFEPTVYAAEKGGSWHQTSQRESRCSRQESLQDEGQEWHRPRDLHGYFKLVA